MNNENLKTYYWHKAFLVGVLGRPCGFIRYMQNGDYVYVSLYTVNEKPLCHYKLAYNQGQPLEHGLLGKLKSFEPEFYFLGGSETKARRVLEDALMLTDESMIKPARSA